VIGKAVTSTWILCSNQIKIDHDAVREIQHQIGETKRTWTSTMFINKKTNYFFFVTNPYCAGKLICPSELTDAKPWRHSVHQGALYANSKCLDVALTLTREEKHSKYYREGKTRSPGPQGQHPLPVRFRFRLTHQSCPISVLICNKMSLISQTTPESNPCFTN